MAIRQIPTGISGFDKLLKGGFVAGSTNLLVGGPGAGKTIFGLEYLYKGIQKGENGVYVSFEQRPDMLIEQAKQFGWDLEKPIKQKKLRIEGVDLAYVETSKYLTVTLPELLKEMKAKRLVIDSLADLRWDINLSPQLEHLNVPFPVSERLLIGAFIFEQITKHLKKHEDVTSLLITEEEHHSDMGSAALYACDSIIEIVHKVHVDEIKSRIHITKARYINHDKKLYDLKILPKKGIIISK